jgi:GxxExxY protein
MPHQLPIEHFQAIAERIVTCAQAVRDSLGEGEPVDRYEAALERALRADKLQFARQYPFGVPFDRPPDAGFYADFVVEGWILVELKALSALTSEHTAQARQYLRESGCRLCLLINFGPRQVEVQHLLPTEA